MRRTLSALVLLASIAVANAQVFSSPPFNLQNGTTADASQVMANFNQVVSNGNANAAHSGANADITGLSALGSGSAAVPSIRFSAATSSGIYWDGTNLGLSVGGAEQSWVPPAASASPAAVFVAGEVRTYAMSTCPTGWVETNGASLLRASFPGLFANIGTTWGAADGTHFSIPNFRGTFLRAWDDGNGVDPGRAFASAQATSNLSHTHTITDPTHAHAFNAPASQPVVALGAFSVSGVVGANNGTTAAAATNISINASGGTESRPVNYAILYCIKT